MDLYERKVILPKDYSFIIVDKNAKSDKRIMMCEQGKVIYPIRISGDKGE